MEPPRGQHPKKVQAGIQEQMVLYPGTNLSLAPPATQSSQWADISITQEFLATGLLPPSQECHCDHSLVSLGTWDSLPTTLHTTVCFCVALASPLLEMAGD